MNNPAYWIDESKLRRLLAEHPAEAESGWLWSASWGSATIEKNGETGGKSVPSIIADLADDLSTATHSRTVLVHGRYGTGKTSFIRLLCAEIAWLHDHEKGPFLCLWLHMPVLTNEINSSALAAVTTAMVNYLEEKLDRHCSRDFPEIHRTLEDLWQIEAAGGEALSRPEQNESPRPNRMVSGGADSHMRYHRANSLEREIDACLDWKAHGECCPEVAPSGKRLFVVLDDLDRCKKTVPEAVIRLLLRFGTTHGVHFIIASDRDVMEEGVRDWMEKYGKDGSGGPLVTANSAIEKYLHHMVQLPDLGKVARVKTAEISGEGIALPEALDEWFTGFLDCPPLQAVDPAREKQTLAELYLSMLLRQALTQDKQEQGEEDA